MLCIGLCIYSMMVKKKKQIESFQHNLYIKCFVPILKNSTVSETLSLCLFEQLQRYNFQVFI